MELLKEALRENTRHLDRLLKSSSLRRLRTRPSDKAWSPLEIVEHLLRSEELVRTAIQQPNGGTKLLPDAQQRLLDIRRTMQDDSRALIASKSLHPGPKPPLRAQAIEQLTELRNDLIAIYERWPADSPCADHLLFGPLNLEEWLFYTLYHAERHTRQITRIVRDARR